MIDSFAILQAMDGISDKDIISAGRGFWGLSAKRSTNKKRLLSFALAAAIILALGTVAYAITRRASVYNGTIKIDGEVRPAIGFESLDDAPVNLGVWALGDLPEDFTLSKSYYRGDEARVDYQNPAGDIISLIYQKPNNTLNSYFADTVLACEDVTINSNSGTYYHVDNGWQYVYWTVEERGIGIQLSVKGDYDALSLANGVHETDERPPMDDDTATALAELGDWQIALPDGYVELVTYGAAWKYGYIYRIYENPDGYEITLNYERSVTTLDGYVDYYRSPEAGYGEVRLAELSVDGYMAWLLENEDGTPLRLTWQDTDRGLTFTLTADNLTSRELTNTAQGIYMD